MTQAIPNTQIVKGISSTATPQEIHAISMIDFEHPFRVSSVTLKEIMDMVKYALIFADFNHLHPQDTANLILKVLSKAPMYKFHLGYQPAGHPTYTILELEMNGSLKRSLFSYRVYTQLVSTQINSMGVQYTYHALPEPVDYDASFIPIGTTPCNVYANPSPIPVASYANPILANMGIPNQGHIFSGSPYQVKSLQPTVKNDNDEMLTVLKFISGQLGEQTEILKEMASKPIVTAEATGRTCIDPSKLQPGVTPNPINFNQIPREDKGYIYTGNGVQITTTLETTAMTIKPAFTHLNQIINTMLEKLKPENFDLNDILDDSLLFIDNQINSYLRMYESSEEYSNLLDRIADILKETDLMNTLCGLSGEKLFRLMENLLGRGYSAFSLTFVQALSRIENNKFSIQYKSVSNDNARCTLISKETGILYKIQFGDANHITEVADEILKDNTDEAVKIPASVLSEKQEHYYHIPESVLKYLLADNIILTTLENYKGIPCDLSYEWIFDLYRHLSGSNPKLDTHKFFENHKDHLTTDALNTVLDIMVKLTSETTKSETTINEDTKDEEIPKNAVISSVGLK